MGSRGFLKVATERLYGWAAIDGQDVAPEVIIQVDGQELCRVEATLYRQDLLDLKLHPTGHCGFEVKEFDQSVLQKATVLRAFVAQTGAELQNSPIYLKGKMSDMPLVDFEPIVFIHLPKTAGTSFRYAVEAALGSTSILKDYGTASPETSAIIRDTIYSDRKEMLTSHIIQHQIKFLTGHFNASRYLPVLDAQTRWCTFLRHPIQRLISDYNHFVRHHGYTQSIADFCSEPHAKNRQTQLLDGLKPEDFFFIGITELYEQSIAEFNRLTGLQISCLQKNTSRKQLTEQYPIEEELLHVLIENNRADLELYEYVKSKFAVAAH